MKNPKVVIIGSGSQFTEFFLQEYFKYEKLKGSTLVFVDRKPERLKEELRLANKLNEVLDWNVNISGTGERIEALEGADFVYCFVAVNSNEAWDMEFKISQKHGLNPFEAYTGGAAGLSFAMRHVPLMLDICSDIEDICPDAWLILDNNPLAKMLAAIQTYANVKFIGYCNGHELMGTALEQFMDMTDRDESLKNADPIEREFMVPSGSIDILLAGINHIQWALEIKDSKTGEDLYPKVMEKIYSTKISDFPAGYRFSFEIAKDFGLIPSPADNHAGDYIWCVDDKIASDAGLEPYPVKLWFGGKDASGWREVADKVDDKSSALRYVNERRTGWMNLLLAHHMISDGPKYFPAINIQNNGAISNLSDDIIVEVPGIIGPDFVSAVQVGPLPEPIAAICELHGRINNIVADAAALGSKDIALQALMLDPFIHSVTKAKALLEDILQHNKKYDTRF